MEIIRKNKNIIVLLCILAVEAILCTLIIHKVKYTEIDWIAYMQEVEGFLQGERNYSNLRGDTGPLVYPAGFVYIFSIIRFLTDSGENIVKAQYIFGALYIVTLAVVIRLYQKGQSMPMYVLIPLMLSKRVHSIFVLRLFNDCIAVLLGYVAIYLFTKRKWRVGCLAYSAAVSVKMNMLLYAPGVLLVLLAGTGLQETFLCLSICAALQVILGLPFLTTFPVDYIKNSFDLGRVFMYKWTVNLKFLPEDVFTSKSLSLGLLLLTVVAFVLFAIKWVKEMSCTAKRINDSNSSLAIIGPRDLDSHFIIVTIFTSNFIGVTFARTLHYQFYCWYFHTLPYLLWHSQMPLLVKFAVLGGVEYAFNVYPATPLSSAILQLCHFTLLLALYFAPIPQFISGNDNKKSSEAKKLK